MPNIGTCKYMFCPIRTCGTWEVHEPSDSAITFIQYPSRKNMYKICIPCPLYVFIAPCLHSVDEYQVSTDGSVEVTRKYVCHTDKSTIDSIYKLECTEVKWEDLGEVKRDFCLRFRSSNEELCEDEFDSLQVNGHYRVEMSIHRENIAQRKHIANKVNEFLRAKGIAPEQMAAKDAPPADSKTSRENAKDNEGAVQLMHNPLLRASESKNSEGSPSQGTETQADNQADDTPQQSDGKSKPRRKTMKEIMNERLGS
eukprot:gb/GECG01005488.1/.p1 GENE.gb/GECG01005488.1/~~gb/GECG01005488.1/.p1  ORF type:complete len:255 (+),score=25.19 gb/GECG01005488.1/:1-765(+)